MKILISLLLPYILYAQWTQKAGDILQLALPVWGYCETFHHEDCEGREAFYWSYGTTLAATYTLKYTIQKPRPDGSDNLSFPSGHTSSAFSGASFLQRRYGWSYGAPAYVLAAFVGYSRIEANRHDIWDVTAGALLGTLSSYLCVEGRHQERLALHLDPASLKLSYSKPF